MPLAAKKPCRHPGCSALVSESGYCATHKKAVQAAQDKQRGSAHQRGYGYRWQQASAGFLLKNKYCMCDRHKVVSERYMLLDAHALNDGVMPDGWMAFMARNPPTRAEVVDHIIPHRGDMKLFWQRSNWQAMSKSCHDAKTAKEDGGFGRGGGI